MTIAERTKKDIYDQEYKKANYDQVSIRVKKGKREEYQQAAENFGLGYAEMIRLAVETFIAERSLQDLPVKPASMNKQPTAEKLTSSERTLLDEFNQLPTDAQKSLIRFLRSVNQHNDATQANSTPKDAPN